MNVLKISKNRLREIQIKKIPEEGQIFQVREILPSCFYSLFLHLNIDKLSCKVLLKKPVCRHFHFNKEGIGEANAIWVGAYF